MEKKPMTADTTDRDWDTYWAKESKDKLRHKETFSQAAAYGLPWHVVVQYWDEEGKLNASYFDSWEDAVEFEKEMKQTND